jgi:2-polyprenyl-3-methyl-5-hydroxy-6-metoxy-1,4-benzoquinol methylase
MSPDNATVSHEAWDDVWRQSAQPLHLNERDVYWGRHGVFVRVLRRQVGSLQGKRVVELGGAGSRFLLAAAKWEGARVTAVDYSEPGLERLRTMFEANECSVETIWADMFTVNGLQGTSDVVFHWGLLEHFPDPVPLMQLSARLLKPGGAVVFSMPNMRAIGATLWQRWSPQSWARHVYHSDAAVNSACGAAGLHRVQCFYWGPLLLQQGPWERTGVLPTVMTVLQRACNLVNRLTYVYAHGDSRLSLHRGFLARLM